MISGVIRKPLHQLVQSHYHKLSPKEASEQAAPWYPSLGNRLSGKIFPDPVRTSRYTFAPRK
jgi:hypothetical protein